jgi:hypothetical protein
MSMPLKSPLTLRLQRIALVVDALRAAPATLRILRLEYTVIEQESHNLPIQHGHVSRISQSALKLDEIAITKPFTWIAEQSKQSASTDVPSAVRWSPRCIDKRALDQRMHESVDVPNRPVVDFGGYLHGLYAKEIASGVINAPRTSSGPI